MNDLRDFIHSRDEKDPPELSRESAVRKYES